MTGLASKNSGPLGKARVRPAGADAEGGRAELPRPGREGRPRLLTLLAEAVRRRRGPVPQPAQMFWLAVRADGIGKDGVMLGCGELVGTAPAP